MIQNLSKFRNIFQKKEVDKQSSTKPYKVTRYDLLKKSHTYKTMERNGSCNSRTSNT